MPKYSLIKCPSCGYVPNIVTDACIKCGSEMKVYCARCGAENNFGVQKCGKCSAEVCIHPENKADKQKKKEEGPAVSAKEEAKPEKEEKIGKINIEIQPIEATIDAESTPEKSARKLRSGRKVLSREQIKILQSSSPASEQDKKSSHRFETSTLAKSARKKNKIINTIAVSTLSLVLFFMLYLIAAPYIPKVKLVMTAKKYLSHLASKEYEEAYKFLSTNSKATCPLDVYVSNSRDYYSRRPEWEFKDIKVYKIMGNAALVKYKLKEGDGPWQDDVISFVNEHDSWRRPYIWNLFAPIDEALEKRDYSQALFLAQKITLTDPLDPRSWGYLCSAEYSMQLYDKAVVSCRKTLEAEKFYPVGFDNETSQWYYFQLANSLKFTGHYKQAFNIYNMLLADKNSGFYEKCQVLINRADAYAQIKNYIDALKDIIVAKGLCPQTFQNDIEMFFRFLKGDAIQEAISFAQKSKFSSEAPSIYEMRRKKLKEMSRKTSKRYVPRDVWSAQHIGGPEYRVFLKEKRLNPSSGKIEKRYLYVFRVNLWTQNIILEKGELNQ